YRAARGAPLRGMGVIVQRQIDAQCAGVLCADDGDGKIIIEYVAGLANRLVAGEADPGRIRIDRVSGAIRAEVEPGETDAFIRQRAPEFQSIAMQLERALGGPQDVEWVIDAAGAGRAGRSRPASAAGRTPAAPAAPAT